MAPYMKESERGRLGRGVYCTTSLKKAQRYGNVVLWIRFQPGFPTGCWNRGIAKTHTTDEYGEWRKAKFNGIYAPAKTLSPAEGDEFCIRSQCILEVRVLEKVNKVQETQQLCNKPKTC